LLDCEREGKTDKNDENFEDEKKGERDVETHTTLYPSLEMII
jgi:hypothetical protein